MALQVVNINSWISENDKFFLPPVCNKMMHNEQLKVMFVGGPNIRKDYHIEEGEEFFYMIKGDMCLKVVERGKHKDIPIKQGQVFLLPAFIPHSPQRQENTVGLVIERRRDLNETDVLRYYVDGTTDILYEKAFYCKHLGVQLGPIIKAFFASEACKTGIPDKDNILTKMPFELSQQKLDEPFSLQDVFDKTDNTKELFPGKNQFNIKIYAEGQDSFNCGNAEHWIWQMNGTSVVSAKSENHVLNKGDCILIPSNTSYSWKRNENSKALLIFQCGPKD